MQRYIPYWDFQLFHTHPEYLIFHREYHHKDDEYSTTQSIIRETLKGFANPWTFKYGELYGVYEKAKRLGVLDTLEPHTTSVYMALGKRLWFSKSTTSLVKITRKEDIDIFEGLLLLRQRRNGIEKDFDYD